MVPTWNRRQQKKKLLSQLSEIDTDFMIRQSRDETQPEDRANIVDKNTTLNNANISIQVNSSQVHIHTLDNNIFSKFCSEVEVVMTSVETSVQVEVLTAIENLMIPRVELAMKSVNVFSERGWIVFYWISTGGIFVGNIESLQLIASSKINSHRDLSRFDDT